MRYENGGPVPIPSKLPCWFCSRLTVKRFDRSTGRQQFSDRRSQPFCSKDCLRNWWAEESRNRYQKNHPVAIITCAWCCGNFSQRRVDQRFCSKYCVHADWLKRHPESVAKSIERARLRDEMYPEARAERQRRIDQRRLRDDRQVWIRKMKAYREQLAIEAIDLMNDIKEKTS